MGQFAFIIVVSWNSQKLGKMLWLKSSGPKALPHHAALPGWPRSLLPSILKNYIHYAGNLYIRNLPAEPWKQQSIESLEEGVLEESWSFSRGKQGQLLLLFPGSQCGPDKLINIMWTDLGSFLPWTLSIPSYLTAITISKSKQKWMSTLDDKCHV